MPNTGAINGSSITTAVGGEFSVDWTNPSNAAGSNTGTFASCALPSVGVGDSYYLNAVIAHSIPLGATIDGIEARVYTQWVDDDVAGGFANFRLQLRRNGSNVGTAKDFNSLAHTVAGWCALQGSSSDKWGEFPLQSDTLGISFYVPAQLKDDVYVYAFEVTIYYTEAGGGGEGDSGSSSKFFLFF